MGVSFLWLLPAAAFAQRGVAILSPIHRTHEKRHERFVRNVLSLEGLARAECVCAFLVDAVSRPIVARSVEALTRHGFGAVHLVDEPAEGRGGQIAPERRHEPGSQLRRRGVLARARNRLVEEALKRAPDVAWTLWLDSDLLSVPARIVPRLLDAGAPVVAPVVLDARNVLYDKNSWAHSEESRAAFAALPPDALVVQGGYRAPTTHVVDPAAGRRHSRDMGIGHLDKLGKFGRRFAPLDAVGTACLLVRRDVFSEGVLFPDELVDHLIESEGFGVLAARAGFGVVADLSPESYVRHA